MCNNSPPPDYVKQHQTRTKTNNKKRKKQQKQTKVSSLKQPSRKTRTKTRKPKFLSLNLQLQKMTHQQQQQQLDLFPLHPENLVEDKDIVIHDDHVASFLFDTTTDTTTTLHGLLSSTTTTTTTTESERDPLSPSLTYHHDHDVVGSLVRTAMKGKVERDESEERWVCYSEVVEEKIKEEDVASCGVVDKEDHDGGSWCGGAKRKKSLALKLDYQEILNAWSDKGPLFVEGETPPQTVPDLLDTATVLSDEWGSVGNLMRVPEMGGDIGSIKVKEEEGNWRTGQREASVLRYKEKRHTRLFSKRIRYEVRKINAEKRPRLKGRFVKRS